MMGNVILSCVHESVDVWYWVYWVTPERFFFTILKFMNYTFLYYYESMENNISKRFKLCVVELKITIKLKAYIFNTN